MKTRIGRRNSHISVFVQREGCKQHNPNYVLSRLLTNTKDEDRDGIFTDGEVEFRRGEETIKISFQCDLPPRPEIAASKSSWHVWARLWTEVVKERAELVKLAFCPDFTIDVSW